METLVINRERSNQPATPTASDAIALLDQADSFGERNAALRILQSRVNLSRREIFNAPLEQAYAALTQGELEAVYYLTQASIRRAAA